MKNIFKAMASELLKAKQEDVSGFPVACAVVDHKTGKVLFVTINKKWTKETIERFHNHAEYMVINDPRFKNIKGEVILYISLPPCSFCLETINKDKRIVKVNYLFDPWGKRNRPTWINSNTELELVDSKDDDINYLWSEFVERMHKIGHKNSLKRLKQKQNAMKIRRK